MESKTMHIFEECERAWQKYFRNNRHRLFMEKGNIKRRIVQRRNNIHYGVRRMFYQTTVVEDERSMELYM